VPAIVSGGVLPSGRRNASLASLFHVADWSPTILGALGGGQPMAPDALSPTIPIDGVDQWQHIISSGSGSSSGGGDAAAAAAAAAAVAPPRTEIVLDHCFMPNDGTGCNHFGSTREGGVGALIGGAGGKGEMKLVAGPNGGGWSSFTNGTKCSAFKPVACGDHDCLFNLTADPGEHNDLSADPAFAAELAALLARYNSYAGSYHPPTPNPPAEDDATCAAAAAAGGFLVPWTSPPAPTPAPPLGPCSPGCEVHNNTGGGGPCYRQLPAAGLSDADVVACRAACCADAAHCVSFVLHEDKGKFGCYLNAANGTKAPYARPNTLLAYPNRSAAAGWS
jgi:hypothetical protein